MENDNVVDDFDSGFSDVPATLTETPEPTVTEEVQVEAPKMARITEDQYQDLTRRLSEIDQIKEVTGKKLDTAFGKLGGLERVINQLQSSTPDGEQLSVSKEDFAELAAEYPELAEMQMAGLNKIFAKLKVKGNASTFDQDQLDQMVQQKLEPALNNVRQDIERKAETKFLNYMREDWKEVVGVPDDNGQVPNTEFRQWLAKQDQKYQQDVNEAWDASVIHNAIRKFESTKQNQEVPNQQKSDRQKQLQAAAKTPRSSGGHPSGPSEDDEFDAGFRG